jgi:hypothetical protein
MREKTRAFRDDEGNLITEIEPDIEPVVVVSKAEKLAALELEYNKLTREVRSERFSQSRTLQGQETHARIARGYQNVFGQADVMNEGTPNAPEHISRTAAGAGLMYRTDVGIMIPVDSTPNAREAYIRSQANAYRSTPQNTPIPENDPQPEKRTPWWKRVLGSNGGNVEPSIKYPSRPALSDDSGNCIQCGNPTDHPACCLSSSLLPIPRDPEVDRVDVYSQSGGQYNLLAPLHVPQGGRDYTNLLNDTSTAQLGGAIDSGIRPRPEDDPGSPLFRPTRTRVLPSFW